ncbi:MAG: hypothetical protein KC561_11760 [Myxococcales bacterium]|nr:hypothetical protein [Myxococcales bacterium]
MEQALTLENQSIALKLHSLLRDIDPARWRDDLEHSFRQRLETLRAQVSAFAERVKAHEQLLASHHSTNRLTEIRTLLATAELPSRSEAIERVREEWEALRQRLQPAYEALAAALRAEAVHVPDLRPTNYARNLLHFGTAFFSFAILLLLPTPAAVSIFAGSLAVTGWSLEITRRIWPQWNDVLMRILGRFAHPHESHRVNSATWYASALFLVSLTGSTPVCLLAVATLGAGDPMAALVGRRFGRTSLVNGRSLEGTLAFIGSATVFGAIVLTLLASGTPHVWTLALAAAVTGAVAELFSWRIDDNFTIPISSAAAAWLALSLLT